MRNNNRTEHRVGGRKQKNETKQNTYQKPAMIQYSAHNVTLKWQQNEKQNMIRAKNPSK